MKVLNEKAIVVGTEYFRVSDYPKLEVIGCNMTSTEHLPWKEIKNRNIKVISLKGETEFLKIITSTAEHTIGLMIALMRNYKTALNAPYKDREEYKGHRISGLNLGIIGMGRIGKQVRDIAKALGISVSSVDNKNDPNLNSLLGASDIISIHIPLENNIGFFTKEMFSKMKPTAILINTSRDAILEKGSLTWALENNIISGASIDFIEDLDLVGYAKKHNNLILTNHLGGATFEDMQRTEEFIIKKINLYLENETQFKTNN